MSTQDAQPVHQFRKRGTAPWWDGYPDNEDGGGPYETRTLYARAALAAQQAAEPVCPVTLTVGEAQKWRIAPVEPTTSMLIAGNHCQPGDYSAKLVWDEMLKAASRRSGEMLGAPLLQDCAPATPQATDHPAHDLEMVSPQAEPAAKGWRLVKEAPSIAECIIGSNSVGGVVDGKQCAIIFAAMSSAMRVDSATAPPPVQPPKHPDDDGVFAYLDGKAVQPQGERDALATLFKTAMEWGRIYWQRANVSDFTVVDVSEQFAEKAILALASRDVQPMSEDTSRLDWMATNSAHIGWNREGDYCRVWETADEEIGDVATTGWHESARAAIDEARGITQPQPKEGGAA